MTRENEQPRGDEQPRKDDEPIVGFDQTNGLAGDLEGDDGGALNPEGERESVFQEVIKHGLTIDENRGDEATTKYSEEN